MKTKTKKPLKRYIVGWKSDGVTHARLFPNLPRARGYVKEFRETVQCYKMVGAGDEVQAILTTLTIYSATLEPIETEVEA